MARFVIAFNMRPCDYYNLTLLEREVLATELARQRK